MNKKFLYIASLLFLAACSDHDDWREDVVAPDLDGQPILFSTGLKSIKAKTRATSFDTQDAMTTELGKYSYVHEGYDLTIEMYEENNSTPLASAIYNPTLETGEGFVNDGLLSLKIVEQGKEGYPNYPLYWPGNAKKYGFKLTAGTASVDPDQGDYGKWLANDRLLGYAFSRVFDESKAQKTDFIDGINYHSNKEWYAANADALGESSTVDQKKTIPIYARHQRSWITIILKAGKGVGRTDLQDLDKISGIVYSYPQSGDPIEITQLWKHYTYEADAEGVMTQTTALNAIVEPFDYLANIHQNIFKVSLGAASGAGLNFSYKASNDGNYSVYASDLLPAPESGRTQEEQDAIDAATEAMQAYNLEAGKHLTITATLSTDRIIEINAKLEDWEEMSMMTICDDFGGNGDPIKIDSRARLIKFLNDPEENKAGNTALISALALNLDSAGYKWPADPYTNLPVETQLDLNCSLNLTGATLNISKQFLNSVASTGTIVNGIFNVVDGTTISSSTEKTIGNTVVCQENKGLIQKVTISTNPDIRQSVSANVASVAAINYGTILNCTSSLMVHHVTDHATDEVVYIGGIAGESKYLDQPSNSQTPRIRNCTVSSRIAAIDNDGTNIIGAGGIVGYAEGSVIDNTNTYGITLLQNKDKFQNIVLATGSEATAEDPTNDRRVEATNNWWPVKRSNEIGKAGDANANANSTVEYEGVLDSQEELEHLLNTDANQDNAKYLIADDFSVSKDWQYGKTRADITNDMYQRPYTLLFDLDGNNKTITTNGTMLFSYITGEIKNLVINCNETLKTETNDGSTDAIAAFAYAVYGPQALLDGIKVKMADDKYIQASQVAGLVLWAYEGATITNCEVAAKIVVQTNPAGLTDEAKRQSGGIVASVSRATIYNCTFHAIGEEPISVKIERSNTFIGGIVGGVEKLESQITEETPLASIKDCVSWWGMTADEEGNYPNNKGSIIGYHLYNKTTADTANGMDPENQGNWWPTGAKPIGSLGADLKEYEKFIGYKNNVTPTEEITY